MSAIEQLPAQVTVSEPETIPVTVSPAAPAVVTLVQGGPRGPVGPQGPSGDEAAAKTFSFDTSSPWTCVHGFGRPPIAILVYDDDGNVRPLVPIANPDLNTTVLSPNPPLAGSVVIL